MCSRYFTTSVAKLSPRQRWRVAEEIFDESPEVVRKELLKYINIILLNAEIRKRGVSKPGNQLLLMAKNGQLKPLKKLLYANNYLPDILNYSNTWEEVEQKWGHEKSWTWHSDTPLLEAIRAGHIDIVRFLLRCGADPTLMASVVCNKYYDALKLAKKLGNREMVSVVNVAVLFWPVSPISHAASRRDFLANPNRPKSFLQLRDTLKIW